MGVGGLGWGSLSMRLVWVVCHDIDDGRFLAIFAG
jgi:hypothetical protein